MDPYPLAHLLHLLAATVWVGGHLVIAIGYLPHVLRGRYHLLDSFEAVYERIALPSLALAIATGVYMGVRWYPVWEWLAFSGRAWVLGAKAALVLATILLAVDARLRIIGRARRRGVPPNPVDLAAHVLGVTAAAVALAVLGWGLRHGWW